MTGRMVIPLVKIRTLQLWVKFVFVFVFEGARLWTRLVGTLGETKKKVP